MNADQYLAILIAAILAGLAIFQLLLIFGLPLGRFAWGGQHEVLPTKLRIGSAISIFIYAAIAHIVLARVGLVLSPLSAGALTIGICVLTAYFALGILLNAISRSRPECLVMTPVVTILAIACFVIAV